MQFPECWNFLSACPPVTFKDWVAVFTMSKKDFQMRSWPFYVVFAMSLHIFFSVAVRQQWCLLNLGIGIRKNHSFCESCSNFTGTYRTRSSFSLPWKVNNESCWTILTRKQLFPCRRTWVQGVYIIAHMSNLRSNDEFRL